MKTFNYFLLFVVITASGCQWGGSEPAHSFSWLTGHWQATDQGFTIQETWTMQGDSLLAGADKAFTNTGQLVMDEKMDICTKEGQVFYRIKLNAKQVDFAFVKMEDAKPNEFVFINPNPGFPERIVLNKTSDTSFIAAIEGGKGENHVRRELAFKKSN